MFFTFKLAILVLVFFGITSFPFISKYFPVLSPPSRISMNRSRTFHQKLRCYGWCSKRCLKTTELWNRFFQAQQRPWGPLSSLGKDVFVRREPFTSIALPIGIIEIEFQLSVVIQAWMWCGQRPRWRVGAMRALRLQADSCWPGLLTVLLKAGPNTTA